MIEYNNDGKVKALKSSHPETGLPETIYTFDYSENETLVFNAAGRKTRYQFE